VVLSAYIFVRDLKIVDSKGVLPLLALLTAVAFISIPVLAAHPVAASPSFTRASILQSCGYTSLTVVSVTCGLVGLEAGEILLFEVSDIPPYSVSDTMGNHFTLLEEQPLPGTAYDLKIFSATISVSAPNSSLDIFTVTKGVGIPSIIGLGFVGATGVEAISTGSGNSTTPHVTAFAPSQGSPVIAGLLMQESFPSNFPMSAGPGYMYLQLGPPNAVEFAEATGNMTTSPFILSSAVNWTEISIAFSPAASSVSPVPQFGVPTILVASVGLVILALMKKAKILKL
jgi:hypothetical protein